MNNDSDQEHGLLDSILIGRIEPQIYSFSTASVPGFLKVGDTFRGIDVRLKEWRNHFRDLVKQSEHSAYLAKEKVYFRDFAVHDFLMRKCHRSRMCEDEARQLDVYYSNEFFKDAHVEDVEAAVQDVREQYGKPEAPYTYYSEESQLPTQKTYQRTDSYAPRENQQAAIRKFHDAVKSGHKKLLMYAVMRFGKSFTAMCCAQESEAALVLILSAKADVKDEWKRTVESHARFENYTFLTATDLKRDYQCLSNRLGNPSGDAKGKQNVVLFLTLQDVSNGKMKPEHHELFNTYRSKIDLLIVDETHFGARGVHYGRVFDDVALNTKRDRNQEIKAQSSKSDVESFDKLDKALKLFCPNVTLHLSGTPYRILMSGEFSEECIISTCSYNDIADAQSKWTEKNDALPEHQKRKEWENPYYGFPQMIRFAFNPSKRALSLMDSLKAQGRAYELNALFQPGSIHKDEEGKKHCQFVHHDEVLDFLQVIDGKREEEELFSFLDDDRIKNGKMCQHMVFVLPFCASCDAMENLLKSAKDTFKNLQNYEVLNIAGHETPFNHSEEIKAAITQCEHEGKKTISLTVNKMLTGTTVKEWDTMLFLKNATSPQEYDQAIFRLQNPYVVRYRAPKQDPADTIVLNKKPQTLLVDFCPDRVFCLQQQKVLLENIHTKSGGNDCLKTALATALHFSPIIAYNAGKMVKVDAQYVLDAVSNYSKNRSVLDESMDIAIDFNILADSDICALLRNYAPITSSKGLFIRPGEGEGMDMDEPEDTENPAEAPSGAGDSLPQPSPSVGAKEIQEDDVKDRLRTYYALILYYACLTDSKVSHLDELIKSLHEGKKNGEETDNERLARNLRLDERLLKQLQKLHPRILYDLDTKIENINCRLMKDDNLSPLGRALAAMKKLGRLSSTEIVMPAEKAEEIILHLPKNAITAESKILDISSKQGEFAVAIYKLFYKRFGQALLNNLFAVPSSSVSYEFTRKIFSILGIPVNNVYESFTDKDLLPGRNKKTCTDTHFYEIIKNMKFDVIVGNPPYQEESLNTRKPPIYHLFYQAAFELADKVSLITPGRFLYRAGQTPKKWMDKMLNDSHLQIVRYYRDSSEVFPTVSITGGVVVTYRDANRDYGKIKVLSEYSELNGILKKVEAHRDFKAGEFGALVSSRGLYRFSKAAFNDFHELVKIQGKGSGAQVTPNSFDRLGQLFLEKKPKSDAILMVGRTRRDGRVKRWIEKKYIEENEYLTSYNVFIPEGNGCKPIGVSKETPIIGEPILGEKMEGHTDTFISIGKFKKRKEAENCLKYIRSKFARTMLGILKVTQHNSKATWQNVPAQDFTDKSDINWNTSISGIDAQLYDKYGLDKSERDFVESRIKPI